MNADIPQFCRCTSSSVAHLRGCFDGWDKTTKGSTGPEERAEVIFSMFAERNSRPEKRSAYSDMVKLIAAHLRAYGEEEFKRGLTEAILNELRTGAQLSAEISEEMRKAKFEEFVDGIEKIASADGFRRGVEEAAVVAFNSCEHVQSKRICVCAREIRKLLQRNQEGRDENISQL